MSLGEVSRRLCLSGRYLRELSVQVLKSRQPCHFHRRAAVAFSTESWKVVESEISASKNQLERLKIESQDYLKKLVIFSNKCGLKFEDEKQLLMALTNESYLKDCAHLLSKTDYQHNGRLSLLGMYTAKRLITEYLIATYPELPSDQLWDLQNAFMEQYKLALGAKNIQLPEVLLATLPRPATAVPRAFLALIGAIYIEKGSAVTWRFIQNYLVEELTESKIKELCQLQHPKFMINTLSTHLGEGHVKSKIIAKSERKPIIFTVAVYCGDEMLAKGNGLHPDEAERKACSVILSHQLKEVCADAKFPREYEDYEEEFSVNLGLITPVQRVVNIKRHGSESFGFNIRGGEKKVKKDKEFLKFHYYSPVFICSINSGGAAYRNGSLEVGDIILAINDRSLYGLDHEKAVKLLKSIQGDCTLTLKHSPRVIIEDQVEMKLKSVLRKKVEGELSQTGWAEWHMALAQLYPEKYKEFL